LFILLEALMSDTNEPIPTHPPSNPNVRVKVGDYEAALYPGFVGKLSVWNDKLEQTVLYEQGKDGQEPVFYLPPGYTKPWSTSTLEFVRPGPRRIVLQVEDAHQQIDRIEVFLKGDAPSAVAGVDARVETSATIRPPRLPRLIGEGEGEDPPPPPPPPPGGVVLVVEDGPVLCPPACPT
jgi:hypothetical protein